jgi:hypothetical protein
LEKEFDNQVDSYIGEADKSVQSIWILIGKYIEKENDLKKNSFNYIIQYELI